MIQQSRRLHRWIQIGIGQPTFSISDGDPRTDRCDMNSAPSLTKAVFNLLAFISLVLLIAYWVWVAKTWIEIAPWRPHVIVSLGAWWIDALFGLPLAVLPTCWIILRLIEKTRLRQRGFPVLQRTTDN